MVTLSFRSVVITVLFGCCWILWKATLFTNILSVKWPYHRITYHAIWSVASSVSLLALWRNILPNTGKQFLHKVLFTKLHSGDVCSTSRPNFLNKKIKTSLFHFSLFRSCVSLLVAVHVNCRFLKVYFQMYFVGRKYIFASKRVERRRERIKTGCLLYKSSALTFEVKAVVVVRLNNCQLFYYGKRFNLMSIICLLEWVIVQETISNRTIAYRIRHKLQASFIIFSTGTIHYD